MENSFEDAGGQPVLRLDAHGYEEITQTDESSSLVGLDDHGDDDFMNLIGSSDESGTATEVSGTSLFIGE